VVAPTGRLRFWGLGDPAVQKLANEAVAGIAPMRGPRCRYVRKWRHLSERIVILLVFLHQQSGEHCAPLLGDSEPAGNVAFDQPPDYCGGNGRAADARPLPSSAAGNSEKQKARGDAERLGLRPRTVLGSALPYGRE
jgi:hypothetical protein